MFDVEKSIAEAEKDFKRMADDVRTEAQSQHAYAVERRLFDERRRLCLHLLCAYFERERELGDFDGLGVDVDAVDVVEEDALALGGGETPVAAAVGGGTPPILPPGMAAFRPGPPRMAARVITLCDGSCYAVRPARTSVAVLGEHPGEGTRGVVLEGAVDAADAVLPGDPRGAEGLVHAGGVGQEV